MISSQLHRTFKSINQEANIIALRVDLKLDASRKRDSQIALQISSGELCKTKKDSVKQMIGETHWHPCSLDVSYLLIECLFG